MEPELAAKIAEWEDAWDAAARADQWVDPDLPRSVAERLERIRTERHATVERLDREVRSLRAAIDLREMRVPTRQ